MARVRREIFRPHLEFVAVRRIKLSADDTLEVGEKLDKSKFRMFHLRSLYARRRIGVVGSEWAEAMLADLGGHARPEVTKKQDASTESPKTTEPQNQADDDDDWLDGGSQDDSAKPEPSWEPVKNGSRYEVEAIPGEKFTSKKKALERVAELKDK